MLFSPIQLVLYFASQDVNPKELHIELVPFLEKNTGLFMKVREKQELVGVRVGFGCTTCVAKTHLSDIGSL